MKKILLFISTAFIIGGAFAQTPTILGTYLPVVNTEIKQVWNRLPASSNPHLDSVMPIPTYGANQLWDYSKSFPSTAVIDTFALKTYSPDSTDTVVGLSNQPLKPYFSDATHASFVESPFPAADSLWSFFKVDTSGMYTVGHFALKAPINDPNLVFDDTTINMIDEELVVPFTIDYNDHFHDSSKQETFFKYNLFGQLRDVKYVRTTQTEYEVKGYGTFISPIDTTEEVLLAVATILNMDSIFLKDAITGDYVHIPNSSISPQFRDSSYVVRHFFLANNTFATNLLMQVNTDTARSYITYGWYTLPSKVGTIEGNVYDAVGSSNGVDSAEVYLFREHGNFTRDDILATVITDANGSYLFEDIPYGYYRVAARMVHSQNGYDHEHTYMTYFEGSVPAQGNPALGVDWTQCELVNTTSPPNPAILGIDIYIQHDTLAPHQAAAVPSLLTGTLTGINLNKQGGDDPIPGIDIIIKEDPSLVPIISTQTDSNGVFRFANLPDGDYKIWVDMPGVDVTSSYNFNVDKGVYNRCEFDFTSDLDSINRTGQNAVTCLTFVQENPAPMDYMSIYPNPFENTTVITLDLLEEEQLTIELYDMTGKLVRRVVNQEYVSGSKQFEINNIIQSGVYFVKVQIGDEIITKKVIKL